MSKREKRARVNNIVHVYVALKRPCHGEASDCIRVVDKGFGDELQIIESLCKVRGGYWRIHRTVNARNCEIARKILMKKLIDFPEKAENTDTEWRTALLQSECKATNFFMFDVDKKDRESINKVIRLISESNAVMLESHMSPKGIHIITHQFDCREVCKLDYVTLLRDGYYFIKEIRVR